MANHSLLPPSFCRLQTCGLANDSLDTFWNSTVHSGIENRSWILAVCLFTLCSQYLQYDDKLLWINFAFSYHSSMQPQGITLAKEVGAVHIAVASSSSRQTSALPVPLFFISTIPYNTLVLYNQRYPSYDGWILDKQQSKWVTAVDTNICVASFSLGCNAL